MWQLVKLVFKYRVKGSASIRLLDRLARRVSMVWNFCNDTQRHAMRWNKRWPTGFDLNALTAGSSKELGIGDETIQAVGQQYAQSRQQFRKRWLRYRGRKTLGWIPFKARGIRQQGDDAFRFMGHDFRVWMSRPLRGTIRCGSFSQDALGNWYINLCCEVPLQPSAPTGAVGVDLGIKTAATMSDGSVYDGGQPYREIEPALAIAQRARKKQRTKALHAKAKNRRKDALHKLSTRLVQQNAVVAVGNVSSQSMVKTRMAKGALDAGWGMFKIMLSYKASARSVRFEVVDEHNSTQTCSACGSLPESRPRGIAGLGIRAWECSNCGASHDRDVNAARNILLSALGGQRPAEGILCL